MLFWAILAITPFFQLCAQKIMYADTGFSVFVPKVIFGEIELGSCKDTVLHEEALFEIAQDFLTLPNGIVWGYGNVNLSTENVFFRQFIPGTTSIWPNTITYHHDIKGLTCDENGKAYAAGWGVTQINTQCCDWEEIYLGDFPPGIQCQGDITYSHGKFYMASIGNKLVEVDMKNPSNSQVVMDFPPGTLPIHGLATVQMDCDSIITYALGVAVDHSEVYEIDFDNWTITQVCDIPVRAITGAGSQTECMLPPCDLFVDLDDDNSSFGFWGNYCADTFCVPPVAVADTDVVILSASGHLDSLVLELGLILDPGQEYLQLAPSGNVGVVGNNSTYLTLTNNGSATIADFETALKAVQYFNDALPLTFGKRMVGVRAWSGGVESLVSTAELPLSNELLHLQADVTPTSCYGFFDGSISVATIGGEAPYTYQWGTGQAGSSLLALAEGVYPLTITDSTGCVKLDTVILTQPDPLTTYVNYTGLPAICDNSGELAAIAEGGTPPYLYNWSNGNAGNTNTSIGPGDYLLTVTDTNGCQATAAYTVASGDTVLLVQQEEICSGESLSWGGGQFSTDTIICQIFTLPNGCDSTVCLSLKVNPLPQPSIAVSGGFCTDSVVVLSVAGPFQAYLWSSGETSPTIAVTAPGGASVAVTNSFGCTAEAAVSVPAGVGFSYSASQPTCFGYNDGRIEVEQVSGGTPPWFYSVDGANFFPEGLFENLGAGVYALAVEDADGCRKTVEVLLEAPPAIFVDAGADRAIQLGEGTILDAVTNLASPTVSWQPPDYLDCPGCLSTGARPLESTRYEILVTDGNGCTEKDTVAILVEHQTNLYVPNAFSPNGDGINDLLTVFSSASVAQILSFQVYDRWGGLVFGRAGTPPNDPGAGWDGTSHGKTAPAGVYAWKIEALLVDGTTEILAGEVALVR